MDKIIDFLCNFVESRGIKQRYISEKTGISDDTISKIFTGKRRILASEFLAICRALNVPSEDIDKLMSEMN